MVLFSRNALSPERDESPKNIERRQTERQIKNEKVEKGERSWSAFDCPPQSQHAIAASVVPHSLSPTSNRIFGAVKAAPRVHSIYSPHIRFLLCSYVNSHSRRLNAVFGGIGGGPYLKKTHEFAYGLGLAKVLRQHCHPLRGKRNPADAPLRTFHTNAQTGSNKPITFTPIHSMSGGKTFTIQVTPAA